MQPFSIKCVTCKSKLTVSKSSLLGQILACPKCGSMVQIPENNLTETEVLTPTTESSTSADVQEQLQDHTDTVEDFGYTASQNINEEFSQIANHSGNDRETAKNTEENLQPETMSEWVDTSATDKRKKLLVTFSCISTLILIGIIITFSLSGEHSSEISVNTNQENSHPVNSINTGKENADQPTVNSVTANVTSEKTDLEVTGASKTERPVSTADNPEKPGESTENKTPDPVEEEVPLPVAPEGLTPEAPDGADAENMSEELDSVIEDIAPFLSNAPIDIENAAPVAKLPTADKNTPRPPATPINIQSGLRFTVPEIDVTNPIPLNKFLEFLGTLGNIPFTYDLESLELMNISYAVAVQHTSEKQTIEQILTRVLEEQQLAHQIKDGHVLILAKSHVDSAISSTIYKQEQGDTIENQPTAEKLSNVINRLLAIDEFDIAKPVADEENEKVFHLEISGTNRTQDRVRKLLTRLQNTQAETDSYEANIWAQYQKKFTMDFNDGTPLLQILVHLNSISELQFQANWKNIWQAGWTPASQVDVTTEDEPLQECLDQALTNNGLSYIARANGVLEITSAAHALAANQIGIYDLKKLPLTKRDALVKTLKQLAEDGQNDVDIRFMETLPDGRMGLSAPAAIHRLVAEQLN